MGQDRVGKTDEIIKDACPYMGMWCSWLSRSLSMREGSGSIPDMSILHHRLTRRCLIDGIDTRIMIISDHELQYFKSCFIRFIDRLYSNHDTHKTTTG